jgi:hypothetical protein
MLKPSDTRYPPMATAGEGWRPSLSFSRRQKLVLAGCAVTAVGAVLPWASIRVGGVSAAAGGLGSVGQYTLFLTLVATVLTAFAWTENGRLATAVTGLSIFSAGFVTVANLVSAMTDPKSALTVGNTTIGPGAYLTVVGGAVITYAGWTAFRAASAERRASAGE